MIATSTVWPLVEPVALLPQYVDHGAGEVGQAPPAERLRLLHVDRALEDLTDQLALKGLRDAFHALGEDGLAPTRSSSATPR